MAPAELICQSVPRDVMEKFYNTRIVAKTLSRPTFSAMGVLLLPPPLLA